jgi:hypothetical protein
MSAAARDLGVAINWRITLLGLNLAAWLAGALLIAALFVHHEMTEPRLYPGFGFSVPMLFNDVPVFYPAKVDNQPVVGLKGISALKPSPAPSGQAVLGQQPHHEGALGQPRPLSAPDKASINATSTPRPPARS